MSDKTVSVIMSTYNGEKYLAEQLESLLNQTYPVSIYIHDDGSTDGTVELLKKYNGVTRNDNKICFLDDEGRYGYPDCFWHTLMNAPTSDYYAFCDQDDVWLPDKIKSAMDMLNCAPTDKPVLQYCAVWYCDENLKPSRYSEFARCFQGDSAQVDPYKLVYSGEALGMTFVMNEALRQKLGKAIDRGYGKFKDEFIKKLAATTGMVYYNRTPQVYYRRHDAAVSGGFNSTSLLDRYLKLIKKYLTDSDDMQEDYYIFGYIFKYEKNSIISREMQKLVWAFRDNGRWIRFWWPHRYRWKLIDELGIRLFILLGKR